MPSTNGARLIEVGEKLQSFFNRLLREFGSQGWWPARTRFEVILGAILTQNTAWRNAALALKRLRREGLLSLKKLNNISAAELETYIRSAGFYRQKARTIRNFLDWLNAAHRGSLARMFATSPEKLRHRLLNVKGLGAETADAILLYAGHQPFFVADAYTRRVLARHELVLAGAGYDEVQRFLHQHLRADAAFYNEFHALLVEAGKRYCKKDTPRCEWCPLELFLPGVRNIEANQVRRPAALGPSPFAAISNPDRVSTGRKSGGHVEIKRPGPRSRTVLPGQFETPGVGGAHSGDRGTTSANA